MSEIIMLVGTLIASIGLVFGVALTAHWSHKRESGILHYYFYALLFVAAFSVLASNRNISIPLDFVLSAAPEEKSPALVWFRRLALIFVLFAVGERLLNRILSQNKKTDIPGVLLFSFILYFLTNVISPAIFGANPSFSHEYFYAFLICSGAFLMNQKEADLSFISARNAVLLFLLASFIMMFVNPKLVLNSNYNGLIPFLKIRLAGLASHANSLGPITVIAMILLWQKPFSSRWITIFCWLLSFTCLVLTQSKTSWIGFLLCVASMYYFTYSDRFKEHFLNYKIPSFSILLLGSAMVLGLTISLMVMFGGVGDSISNFFNSTTGTRLSSFSGRDVIWDIAINEWEKSPIFGYGVTIWDESFRMSIRMANATSAHNQFYQSLSSAGIVGATGLVIYAAVLFYFSIITARRSKGISLAFFLLIFSGSFSEASLVMDAIGPGSTLSHILLLIVLVTFYERREKKTYSVRSVYPTKTMNGAT